ncbi:MAG: hypothetical protein IRZ04_13325 [Rhodospirillales bacterium]|nr:hypothetical protein [Rhodospirillales bacterium]
MDADPKLAPLLDLVKVMDEKWGLIAVAMRLTADPRYLEAFTQIDGAFRRAKAAIDRESK